MGDDQSRTSPSESYARFKDRQAYPEVAAFTSLYSFSLDDFQLRACREVEDGKGVLVAAPTGSGKTVVGEFAVHLALQTGRKCFYTTPIKALSNQKYADLVARYGADAVGLLTGDHSVNGEAPIVVMTTEVLRNMLYAGSATLSGLGYVVMDEVHYLADRMRGAVWEEVIIHLPESVAVISLSATVSNAEEFGEWLNTVRGDTTTIVEEKRPVPLFQHVIAGRRIHDLFASSDVDAKAGFVKEGAPVNPHLLRIARDEWASRQIRDRRSPKARQGKGSKSGKGGKHGRDRAGGSGGRQGERRDVGNGRRVWIPSRVDVVDRLEREQLLPAIVFIFSRAGCDAAVRQCLEGNLQLTTPEERAEVIAYAHAHLDALDVGDRAALGYREFLDGIERGVAAHHAGMLPVFKECVEELFRRGLCKVVFATETLALGINMPARTVVIEKLSKWNGETHVDISPGEYTQLTGRAGRRGLDVEGHAVVLWQPGTDPKDVAGLASTRTYPLRSSFRPSYNMAVNLVHHFGRERARELLQSSFAQFQADRAVVGLAAKLRKSEDALDGYAEAAHCDKGDFMAYAALRQERSALEKSSAKTRRVDRRDDVLDSLARLRPGDLIEIPRGKYAGFAVVVDPGLDGHEPRPSVVTADRQARRLALTDFGVPVEPLGRVRVPRNFNGRNPAQRNSLAGLVAKETRHLDLHGPGGRQGRSKSARHDPLDTGPREATPERERIEEITRLLRDHPCHSCPDREDHARWAERWHRLDADTQTLRRRIENRTHTIARQFDRVCEVLTALDYLDGDEITLRGRPLMRIYTDADLVAAEALHEGVWDDLSAEELVAALSALVFESRRTDGPVAPIPTPAIREAVAASTRIWADLEALERQHKLDFLRRPDPGFTASAYHWALGMALEDVLEISEITAGDFVRTMKQLIDFLEQVAAAAGPDSPVRSTARRGADLVRRGVVEFKPAREDLLEA